MGLLTGLEAVLGPANDTFVHLLPVSVKVVLGAYQVCEERYLSQRNRPQGRPEGREYGCVYERSEKEEK